MCVPFITEGVIAPDYTLGTHTASLGLVFYRGSLLPQRYADGARIGQHGLWNRKPRSGYKVIFVAFADGRPVGAPEDVLTGFVNAQGDALGRPVGVAVDRAGALPREAGCVKAVISPALCELANRTLRWRGGTWFKVPGSPYSTNA